MNLYQHAQDNYCALVSGLNQKNVPPGGENMIKSILTVIPSNSRKIIDLGCNTGWVTRELAKAFNNSVVIGIDINYEMICSARKIAELEGSSARFECADGSSMIEFAKEADVIICAGSAAFMSDPKAVYQEVYKSLLPNGILIDCHYIYQNDVPPILREEERDAFGILWRPASLSEIIEYYEAAELNVLHIERFPIFEFPKNPLAEIYRDILRNDLQLKPLIDEMVKNRELMEALSPYRHPYLVITSKTVPITNSRADSLLKTIAVMDLFNSPVIPKPITKLRDMKPYEFLAYIGDPDAAPGGGKSVALIPKFLIEAGLNKNARIVDVGCFTGLSSIILGSYFDYIEGVDIDEGFLYIAQSVSNTLGLRNVSFTQVDWRSSGYTPNSLDAVIMTATLAYTPEPQKLVEETKKVLKKNGIFVEFLYHHFDNEPSTCDALRRCVGEDIVLAPFSVGVQKICDLGFSLLRAEYIETSSVSKDYLNSIRQYISTRELSRDPEKRLENIDEFSKLFEKFAPRLSYINNKKPIAYCCLFEKI